MPLTPTLPADSHPTVSAGEPIVLDAIRLSVPELQQLQASGVPLYVLDVRRERAYAPSPSQARGAVRIALRSASLIKPPSGGCRERPGWSPIVLDRRKRPAPVWRKSYNRGDGSGHAR
jgi:hypothetical protein